MEDTRIVMVPANLHAVKTKDTVSKRDVAEINEAMQCVFITLENDRDFPLRIKLQVKLGTVSPIFYKLLSIKNASIVREKFEQAGYEATLEIERVLVLAQPISEPNQKKKQKVDDLPPPSYQ